MSITNKTTKIIYWIPTVLFSLLMLYSAYAYFNNHQVHAGFVHLGFPDYFRKELGIAKLIGAIVLLAPLPGKIKEWAYAGFSITLISALIAHISSGDGINIFAPVLIAFILLILSYIFYSRVNDAMPAIA
jgi:hypothetical protein